MFGKWSHPILGFFDERRKQIKKDGVLFFYLVFFCELLCLRVGFVLLVVSITYFFEKNAL